MKIGYHLSSEEHGPRDLVRFARMGEDSGAGLLTISDHFHPWVPEQGHSPNVWAVLGAIAEATERAELLTTVTCPMVRQPPVTVAHSAATVAVMSEGRFRLGVGTGERLNEHVTGEVWPAHSQRVEMLDEAVDVMRRLWSGRLTTFKGTHYTVENARLYDVPDDRLPVYFAASGDASVDLAAGSGDGMVLLAPDSDAVTRFRNSGNTGPVVGMTHVCWADSEDDARELVHRTWPNSGIPSSVSWEIALPEHFADVAQLVTPEQLAGKIVMGPDVDAIVDHLRDYAEAGFDAVSLHQIGPDQEGFLRQYRERIQPAFEAITLR